VAGDFSWFFLIFTDLGESQNSVRGRKVNWNELLPQQTHIGSRVYLYILRMFIYSFSAQLTACLCDMAGHFKTDPTETVALSFGYRVFEPIDTVSTD
jgi:hypothetical protein